jgi:ribosomal protein S8
MINDLLFKRILYENINKKSKYNSNIQLFENILFECRKERSLKFLHEKYLREMAIIACNEFARIFLRQLKNETSINRQLSILYSESSQVFENIIKNMIKQGYLEESPFAIKEKPKQINNNMIIILYACSEKYKEVLNKAFQNKKDSNNSIYSVVLVNKDKIDNWVNNMLKIAISETNSRRLKDILSNTEYQNTIKKCFFKIYSNLPEY